MGQLDDELMDSKDYPWLVNAGREPILLCVDHLEKARQCQNGLTLGVNLKMASRALRCAMEVYGMRLKKENVE